MQGCAGCRARGPTAVRAAAHVSQVIQLNAQHLALAVSNLLLQARNVGQHKHTHMHMLYKPHVPSCHCSSGSP